MKVPASPGFGGYAALSAAVAVLLAACGGSGAQSPSSSASQSPAGPLQTLNIAYPANNAFTMETYVGVAKGFFKDNGVDVQITDGLGSNAAALVVSGQYDLTVLGTTAPLLTAAQGKPTSSIRAVLGGGNGGSLLVNPTKFTSLQALEAAPSCTLATFPPGTSAYGFAVELKNKLNLHCSLSLLATAPLQAAAVDNGSADGIVGSKPNFDSAIAAGKLKVLIDTSNSQQRQQYYGAPYIETTEWGLTSNLQAKRSAIVDYLKGIKQSDAYLKTRSNAQIAQILVQFPAFQSVPLGELTSQVQYPRVQLGLGSSGGYITQAEWQTTLNALTTWGVPNYNPSNPVFSYGQRVDMSYWTAAYGSKPSGT